MCDFATTSADVLLCSRWCVIVKMRSVWGRNSVVEVTNSAKMPQFPNLKLHALTMETSLNVQTCAHARKICDRCCVQL